MVKKTGCLGYIDVYRGYGDYFINHHKNPYQTTSIMDYKSIIPHGQSTWQSPQKVGLRTITPGH